MKNIQLLFTEDEHSVLKKLADERSLNVATFIKEHIRETLLKDILNSAQLTVYYNELLSIVDGLHSGTPFTVRSVFPLEKWNEIPRGEKLILGKIFYKAVLDGLLNVDSTEKDSSNTMWYKKR